MSIKPIKLEQNKVFFWISAITILLLLMPFIAMQLTDQVNWEGNDFVIMGILIFGSMSLFVILARKLKINRYLLAVLIFFFTLYIWAEIAVGVFTTIGS